MSATKSGISSARISGSHWHELDDRQMKRSLPEPSSQVTVPGTNSVLAQDSCFNQPLIPTIVTSDAQLRVNDCADFGTSGPEVRCQAGKCTVSTGRDDMENTRVFPVSPRGQRNGRRVPTSSGAFSAPPRHHCPSKCTQTSAGLEWPPAPLPPLEWYRMMRDRCAMRRFPA